MPVPTSEKVILLNTGYTNTDIKTLLQTAMRHVETREKASLVFLNTDVVVKAEKDNYLKKIITETEYVLADGMPLIWISRLFCRPLKEKVSGSDFVPLICREAAGRGYSLFFVGGMDAVAKKACQNLKDKYPGIIVHSFSPPFGFEKNPDEVENVNRAIINANPDILIVCLGCPKQEKFIYENRSKYDVPLSICAGATIDFLAGHVKRCPPWMSRCGLEWFYRFLQEPKRLFKRYFIDDMQILGMVLKYWRH